MSVNVIDTIKPKNGGSFPVVEAVDVAVSGGTRLNAALDGKANTSDITTINTQLASKADTTDLAALSATVSTKANQSDISELRTTIALKASQSSLDSTNAVVALKAAQSSLDALSVVVDRKADKRDYDNILAEIDTKASILSVDELRTDMEQEDTNLQNQINQIVISASAESVVAPEVAAARVDSDGTSYSTLKERLDADVAAENNHIKHIGSQFYNGTYAGSGVNTEIPLVQGNLYVIHYQGENANIYNSENTNDYFKAVNNGTYYFRPLIDGTLCAIKTGSGEDNAFRITISNGEILSDITTGINDPMKYNDINDYFAWHLGGYDYVHGYEVTANNAVVSRDIVVSTDTNISIRILSASGIEVYFGEVHDTATSYTSGLHVHTLEAGHIYRLCIFRTDLTSLSPDFSEIFKNIDMRWDVLGEEKIERFQVKVPCGIDRLDNTLQMQDYPYSAYDYGLIMLPKTYSKSGKKTRMIIFCHGAGGSVNVNDSVIERLTITKYLVANGYAVMDTNGLPESFANTYGYNLLNNIGSYVAMRCYSHAYNYCLNHYNIFEEVLVYGESMGGIVAANLVMGGYVPALATALGCPVTSAYDNIWLHPWSNGAPKNNMIKFYEFQQVDNEYVYDAEKLKGYDPINNNTITDNDGNRVTQFPSPLKIWHCEDDDVVSFSTSETFVEQIRRSGNMARLRPIAEGGHGPLSVGEPLSSTYGFNTYQNETLTIKPIVEEIYLWFAKYEDVNV